ncbi:hypothetical protein H8356DRAFT_930976 [Neocallimastix lanati (nom. inval.)]|uniref:Uncharacterized protein n=1 Tax=Neocallimastix californiae TaxID=1754190 RepID=A0A1Y2FCT0_9FUNG|nr:hypothetical protein H8356DRAFT_930976 [Neocallimastix sp. JGI-2020a]ORY81723.1 hypothetical protein LY90DRAFT_664259 [Neocallimastix californiae]|eukprot:ORY81723.1 hypothetical protein LY90DRAFT_664259 [Neocallimastix californiae]
MSTLYSLSTASKKANEELNPKLNLMSKNNNISLSPKIKRTIDEHHKKSKIIRNRNYNYVKSTKNQVQNFNFNKNNIQKNFEINSLVSIKSVKLDENQEIIDTNKLLKKEINSRKENDTQKIVSTLPIDYKSNDESNHVILNSTVTYYNNNQNTIDNGQIQNTTSSLNSQLLSSSSSSPINLSHSSQKNKEDTYIINENSNSLSHSSSPSILYSNSSSSSNSSNKHLKEEEEEELIRDIELKENGNNLNSMYNAEEIDQILSNDYPELDEMISDENFFKILNSILSPNSSTQINSQQNTTNPPMPSLPEHQNENTITELSHHNENTNTTNIPAFSPNPHLNPFEVLSQKENSKKNNMDEVRITSQPNNLNPIQNNENKNVSEKTIHINKESENKNVQENSVNQKSIDVNVDVDDKNKENHKKENHSQYSSSLSTIKEDKSLKNNIKITIHHSLSSDYIKEREQTPSPPDHVRSHRFSNSKTFTIPKIIDTPLYFSSTLSSSSSSSESSHTVNEEGLSANSSQSSIASFNHSQKESVIIRRYKEKSETSDPAKKNLKLKNKKLRSKSKPSHVNSLRKEILKRNLKHENDKNELINKRLKLDGIIGQDQTNKKGSTTNSSSATSSLQKSSRHSSILDKNSKIIKKSSSSKNLNEKLIKKINSSSSLDSYIHSVSRNYMPVGIALKKEQGIITKHGVIPFKNDKSNPIDRIHHEIPVLTGNTANLINSFLAMSNNNINNSKVDNKLTSSTTNTTTTTNINSIEKYMNKPEEGSNTKSEPMQLIIPSSHSKKSIKTYSQLTLNSSKLKTNSSISATDTTTINGIKIPSASSSSTSPNKLDSTTSSSNTNDHNKKSGGDTDDTPLTYLRNSRKTLMKYIKNSIKKQSGKIQQTKSTAERKGLVVQKNKLVRKKKWLKSI